MDGCTAPTLGHRGNSREAQRCPVHGAQVAATIWGTRAIGAPTSSASTARDRFDNVYEMESLLDDAAPTDEATLRLLAQAVPYRLYYLLVAHPNCPTDLKLNLAKHLGDDVVAHIIDTTPDLSPEALGRLNQNVSVVSARKAALTRHPNASSALLASLMADVSGDVGYAALNHPNAGEDVQLAYLRAEPQFGPDADVKLANHPKVTPGVLEMLADNPDYGVQEAVAANLKTPPWVLRRIADASGTAATISERTRLVITLAQNPSTPSDILQAQARRALNAGVPLSLGDQGHSPEPESYVFDAIKKRAAQLGIDRSNTGALTALIFDYEIDMLTPWSQEVETLRIIYPNP